MGIKMIQRGISQLPSWLKQDLPDAQTRQRVEDVSCLGVNTVCREAKCPNINTCFSRKQAAFMILGKSCTRNCRFCNMASFSQKKHRIVPKDEPQCIARAASILGSNYVVITSVTRDDLEDGGASQFVKVIQELHCLNKEIRVEVLIPDFQGKTDSLAAIIGAHPFILAHNLETVKRLYRLIRPEADYQRSLHLLRKAKELCAGIITKSALILGFGESEDEVVEAMQDLRAQGCDILTLGQYLAPSPRHYPVNAFILPEQFEKYRALALGFGFKKVFSGPKVRSSYYAEELGTREGEMAYA